MVHPTSAYLARCIALMRSGKKSWSRKPLACLDLVVHPHECKQSKRETRSDVSRILRRSRTYAKRSHYDAKVSHRDAKRSHPDTKVSHPDAKKDASFESLLDVNDDASARYRKRPTHRGVFLVAKPKKHPKIGFLSLHNSDLRRFWHVFYFGYAGFNGEVRTSRMSQSTELSQK